MTPAPWQGTRPPDRMQHGWRCIRTGARVETVRRLPNGEALTVEQRGECGGDDLEHQLRAEAERQVTP